MKKTVKRLNHFLNEFGGTTQITNFHSSDTHGNGTKVTNSDLNL
jgi:hypothetical protein